MYHLVLSENKDLWSKSNKNIYLGSWVIPDVLKEIYSEYDVAVPDWHWDNIDKFYEDSLKVWDKYENFIVKFSEILNEIHGLSWSVKAWKMLIGPWLRRYLTFLYDRIGTINTLYNSYDIKSCAEIDRSLMDLKLNDFHDLGLKYHKEDYNIIIYTYILKKLDKENKIIFNKVNFQNQIKTDKNIKNKEFSFKETLKSFLFSKNNNFLFSFFIKKNDYYIHSVYLKDKFELLKLNLKLKNFPYIRPMEIKALEGNKFDKILRNKFQDKIKQKLDLNNGDLHNEVIIELIYYMFPMCYLENFKINRIKSKKNFQYFNPKVILDSTGYHKDELFKFWLAEIIQKNTKYILFQHGGYYENFKFKDDFLGHELDISDKYISWGWNRKSHNVSSVGVPISFQKKLSKKDNNVVNFILRPVADYFKNFSTSANPSKNSEFYINDIINIANNIDKSKKLRFFLHPTPQNILKGFKERGYPFSDYLKKRINNTNIEFFRGGYQIQKYINTTDMNICTYLGTPYNQAISADIPCLLFHNEMYEPLNEEYRHVYNSMIKSKLMHSSPITLANQINDEDHLISDWWNQKDTFVAKDLFCANFARKAYNKDELKEIIESVI